MNTEYGEPSVTDEIIAFLLSARSMRLRKRILWERVKSRSHTSNGTYYQSMYRLRKRGVLCDMDDIVELTEKGKNIYQNYCPMLRVRPIGTQKILVLFDIPEERKRVREWIRLQLKMWDFTMVQKSAWLGDGPLPKEFTDQLRKLGMEKNVKIFPVKRKLPL